MQGVSTFNDDIESTAAAIVASFLGAEKLKGVPALKDQTVLMLGAGQANIGGDTCTCLLDLQSSRLEE